MNKTIETLLSRTSLRKYASKPINQEHLDIIIQAAMRAPTAGNMMPYSIIVIRDQEKKESLSHTCDEQPFIAKSPVVLIFIADYQKWVDYYRINNVETFCLENKSDFNRPSEASLFLATQDALIAAQNAVIAAESLGIGTCYIGDIMEHYEKHKELLNLPEFAFPVGMLCLGYYPEGYQQVPKKRFDKEYIVFNEEYKRLDDEDIKSMFKHLEGRFTYENKFNAKNFAQMHYSYKTNADFSKEMARSIGEALKIWNGKKI
ncbi:nitroreductase family protein [Alkaliphilus peptidifermentans]|uniref:FMN reductase (NADPH) n=1 Tax=Alkaliphilus peptidifermentans DSM 18978 TaxID=1120976 RepID=A0A1G5KPH3_9FIRM|nr:nitroreductase family protein [Alkaliphilus peptidifermentans]SCZ02101.1 FMN reductase (NADPH) [Alkaliphilus peptidifermentans DSM 18978]